MKFAQQVWPAITRFCRLAGRVAWRALTKYDETDGEQRAASFAYYAFFSIFPLMIFLISIAAMFFGDPEYAQAVVTRQVHEHLPVDPETADRVLRTVKSVVESRGRASIISFLVLVWSSIRFFQALVRGVNRAWGTKEFSWWRLPIKNLAMVAILASALVLGVLAPAALEQLEYLYTRYSWEFGVDFIFVYSLFSGVKSLLPPLVLFYGFLMFFKFAPQRRTTFREVWVSAAFVTVGLDLLQRLFVLYTKNIANFNTVYGTFGSVVALLMWIYLSGSLIILGGCLAAARYEIAMSLTDQSEPSHPR